MLWGNESSLAMSSDKTNERCSCCGVKMPRNATGGHCQGCLLRLALESEPEGSTLEHEAIFESRSEAPGVETGACIGRYRVCEKLGEGGCGLVFRAEQEEPFRREVALKILKPGLDSRQIIARFEAERQALALLEHPGIAKVFDGGVAPSGRPYFVMELVRGSRITAYADEHRMEIAARLELFVKVCRAISHAHAKGIVHRDIKPANVLVAMADPGGEAFPKVIDFGLSKSLEQPLSDKTIYTSLRQFIGTPAYMSPEQAGFEGGEIDARTDIYALGVLLYELLTGEVPLADTLLSSKATDVLLKAIREIDPILPSKRLSSIHSDKLTELAVIRNIANNALFVSQIKGDLDWIVMKCLEKESGRRYQSVENLIADIEAFLGSRPIQAGNPGWGYRCSKYLHRKKSAVLSNAVVILILLTGIGIGITQYRKSGKAVETIGRVSEESHLQQRSLQIRAGRAKVQEELLDSLIHHWQPPVSSDGKKDEKKSIEQLLDDSLVLMEIEAERDPRVHAEMMETFAEAYYQIANYSAVETLLAKALKLSPQHVEGDDAIRSGRRWNLLGNALYRENKTNESQIAFAKALGYQVSKNNKSPYASVTPVSTNLLLEQNVSAGQAAESLASIGYIFLMQGKSGLASAFFQEGIGLEEGVNVPDKALLAALHGNEAAALSGEGNLEDAEAQAKLAVQLYQSLGPRQQIAVMTALSNLGEIFRRDGRYAEAEQADREALTIASTHTGNARDILTEAGCTKRLAIDLSNQNKNIEAEKYFNEADVLEKRAGSNRDIVKTVSEQWSNHPDHPLVGMKSPIRKANPE